MNLSELYNSNVIPVSEIKPGMLLKHPFKTGRTGYLTVITTSNVISCDDECVNKKECLGRNHILPHWAYI